MTKTTSNVNLICLSSPSAITDCNTAAELVAYIARVSNPGNQANKSTASRLLRYLIGNNHWSPFEMVSITMEIETTRDIARQILRHRSFSFQEFSQRYANPVESLGFETREARLQDTYNRQNSYEIKNQGLQEEWRMKQAELIRKVQDAYYWALSHNIAKEQARAVLPEGLTMSRMYMAGTLRSWIHYCSLRRDNGTQKEHREIAENCWSIIGQHFPAVVEALAECEERESL